MTGACHAPVSCRQESDDCSDFTESGCAPLDVAAFITFSVKIKMKNFASYKTIENRVAGIADTVQRGLGMLPQQAICKNLTQRENRKNE